MMVVLPFETTNPARPTSGPNKANRGRLTNPGKIGRKSRTDAVPFAADLQLAHHACLSDLSYCPNQSMPRREPPQFQSFDWLLRIQTVADVRG